jgi:hypothetical protein
MVCREEYHAKLELRHLLVCSTMAKSYTLVCVILQEPPALPSVFKVIVPVGNDVIGLQDAIKKKKGAELDKFDADSLVLWKVNLS